MFPDQARCLGWCRLRFLLDGKQFRDPLQPGRGFAGKLACGAQQLPECGECHKARIGIGRQKAGDSGKRRLLVYEQHEILVAKLLLELLQRRAVRFIAGFAQAPDVLRPALIGMATLQRHVKHAANHGFAQTAHADARLQFRYPGVDQRFMQRAFSGPACRRAGRVDADGCLQQR